MEALTDYDIKNINEINQEMKQLKKNSIQELKMLNMINEESIINDENLKRLLEEVNKVNQFIRENFLEFCINDFDNYVLKNISIKEKESYILA